MAKIHDFDYKKDGLNLKLRSLSGIKVAEVMDEVKTTEDGNTRFTASAMRTILGYGVVDWGGKEMDDLEYLQVVDLSSEIFNESFLSEDDRKKS